MSVLKDLATAILYDYVMYLIVGLLFYIVEDIYINHCSTSKDV